MPKGKLFKSSEIWKSMKKTSDNCEMGIEKIKMSKAETSLNRAKEFLTLIEEILVG